MFLKDKNNFTVSKADALTTARNIGKASFNGSANITLAQIMGHYTTTSSGNGTYNNKWTKFATIDLSSGTYKECTGQLIFTSKESDIFSGILQFYFRTGSAISSTSISLKWTELTNSSYATSVAAVKVSDGKYDLYFKPTANYTTMNITAICQQVGYLTLYSNQSYVDSITAAATSSLSGYVYNASTANTLTTARTINGTSFNGSANITTANWGTARNITIGNTAKSVNGSGNVSWSLSEIGAAAASHGRHVPDVCTTITDWNAATTNGWYMGNNAANAPTSGSNVWYFGEVVAHNTNYLMQTVYQFTASADAKAIPKYIRARTNGTWGAWTNVTVSIAVPSNAKFTDTNTWRGVQDNLTSTATDQSLSANQGKVLKGLVDGKANSSHTHNYAGSSSAGGNANAAVKLATARTINGTSFNGSANITTANWGTARTLTIGNSGKSVNGSGNISWSWNEMQVPRAYSSSYNFGGNQNAITTAQFLTMLGNLGAFSQPYWVSRGSWSYASNQYINDTGCGNIHLAGCTVEVIGSSTSNCTIRVITPTTSSSGVSNGEFIYINNGSDYSPGWRRQYNTKYKPSASEIGALPTSGGTMTGDLTLNNYLKINAWSGYGSGTADLWYNGNAGNIHCSSGIRTDKALHSAWHNTFEDGFNIPTRDGGNRRGVMFNTYGSGDNSYLEIVRRNSADTDWDWGNSIKFYPHEVKVPSLQCYGGGSCFKLYPGNAGHTYMGFFLNGTTRGAWMGYGSSGSTQFTISADGGTGRVDIHNLNVHGIPLSIQSSAPGCGGVWIQI